MGCDKALLTLQGVPLLRRTWEVAAELTSAVYVVTPTPERYRQLLPATARWLSDPESPPTAPRPGPLVAFTRALAQLQPESLRTGWVLLLACDLPELQAAVLQQWAAALPQVDARAIAYLPRSAQGWDPLCGFYRRRCLSALQTYVAAGGRSFQGWLQQQLVQAIPAVPATMLINCNTPADWQQYGDRISQVAPSPRSTDP